MIPPYSRTTFARRRRMRRLVRTGILAALLLLVVVFVFVKPFSGSNRGGAKNVGSAGGRPAASATSTGAASSPTPSAPPTSTLSTNAPAVKVDVLAKGLLTAMSRASAVADGQTILVLGG